MALFDDLADFRLERCAQHIIYLEVQQGQEGCRGHGQVQHFSSDLM